MNRDRSEKPSLSDRGLSDPRLSDPQLSDRGRAREDEKRQRLAAALRDNLRKRKAQSRDRAAGGPADPKRGEASGGEA
jgi:hypothetical protein